MGPRKAILLKVLLPDSTNHRPAHRTVKVRLRVSTIKALLVRHQGNMEHLQQVLHQASMVNLHPVTMVRLHSSKWDHPHQHPKATFPANNLNTPSTDSGWNVTRKTSVTP